MPSPDSLYLNINRHIENTRGAMQCSSAIHSQGYGQLFADKLRISLQNDPEFQRELLRTLKTQIVMPRQAVISPYRPQPTPYPAQPQDFRWLIILRDGAFLGMDIYDGYIHNHTTYVTTRGKIANIYKPNGKVNSLRAAQYANLSRFVKGVAIGGSIISVGLSSYSIAESISNDQTPEALDIADVSVGLLGLGSTALVSAGIISNPVGWGIGLGVTIYGAGRLIYDIFWSED